MKTTLIIIRGNSGSGKTTLAHALQKRLGRNTLLVSQDVVRRDMLMSDDHPGNIAIALIKQIALYGNGRVPVVIVEGILARDCYGQMLAELSAAFDQVLTYYFDIDLATTLRRHQTRQREFGIAEMRQWWLPDDVLNVTGEWCFGPTVSLDDELQQIITAINT